MKGEDSLEQVMREENTAISFPVLTIGSLERLDEADYREQCVERLIEIVLDIDNYKGAGRLFIPFQSIPIELKPVPCLKIMVLAENEQTF